MNKIKAVLRMTAIQVLLTTCAAALAWKYVHFTAGRSLLYGGLFFAVDFILIAVTWGLIFSKKYIALVIGVSVFKFSILGIILYDFIVKDGIHPLFFGAGCALFTFTAMIESFWVVGKDRPAEIKG